MLRCKKLACSIAKLFNPFLQLHRDSCGHFVMEQASLPFVLWKIAWAAPFVHNFMIMQIDVGDLRQAYSKRLYKDGGHLGVPRNVSALPSE